MSDPNQAPPSTCRACAAAEMFGPLRLYPETGMGDGNVLVSTMRSGPLRRPRAAPITVWVCRRCGLLDLFAAAPEALFERWSAENS
jgi:hypothetical protein